MSELIEAIKTAIKGCDEALGFVTTDREAELQARAALAAVEAGGWRLVPVEPTGAMVEAARRVQIDPCQDRETGYTLGEGDEGVQGVWRAMLKAAPQPEMKP